MLIGVYSEMQCHPTQTHEQVFREVLEQVVNADRLGYDVYAVIEHPFFERFGISTAPLAFFAAAAQLTEQIRFRTALHVLPLWNPAFLASQIAAADHLTNQRYEFGVGRGHAWLWEKAGIPVEETRPRYDEAREILLGMLENPDGFSHQGQFWNVDNAKLVPRPKTKRWRILTGGTSDGSYELAGRMGWLIGLPILLPLESMQQQLEIYREACGRHGHQPDMMWGHAVHLDEDRDTALREARDAFEGFLDNNASPTAELPPKERLEAAGYAFYTSGALQGLAAKSFDELIEEDLVWVGTPQDVSEKIEQALAQCEGLTELSFTFNPGGMEHWKVIKTQELFAREVMPRFRGELRVEGDEA